MVSYRCIDWVMTLQTKRKHSVDGSVMNTTLKFSTWKGVYIYYNLFETIDPKRMSAYESLTKMFRFSEILFSLPLKRDISSFSFSKWLFFISISTVILILLLGLVPFTFHSSSSLIGTTYLWLWPIPIQFVLLLSNILVLASSAGKLNNIIYTLYKTDLFLLNCGVLTKIKHSKYSTFFILFSVQSFLVEAILGQVHILTLVMFYGLQTLVHAMECQILGILHVFKVMFSSLGDALNRSTSASLACKISANAVELIQAANILNDLYSIQNVFLFFNYFCLLCYSFNGALRIKFTNMVDVVTFGLTKCYWSGSILIPAIRIPLKGSAISEKVIMNSYWY